MTKQKRPPTQAQPVTSLPGSQEETSHQASPTTTTATPSPVDRRQKQKLFDRISQGWEAYED